MTTKQPLKMRVRPISLPKVKEQHLMGVFGDFGEVVKGRADEMRQGKSAVNQERTRFFDYLLTQVDPDDYGALQQHYLDQSVVDRNSDIAKYIDPIVWFESKLAVAQRAELHNKPPMKILDIGTGPGHFPVVARFYGHDVTGTDLPKRSQGVEETGHLYDALCDIYKVKRISHMIKAGERIGTKLAGPYDMVTAFLAAFNMDGKTPWTAEQWRFFLKTLKEDVLAPHGVLFMSLANNKLTDESWDYLAERADWTEPRNKLIFISNFTPFL